jgi:anti-sigma regulatory factor (Ser/Thr protein kinase)
MATVELRFGTVPAHVRTARLIAAAVARRSGVDDALIDEVKLAIGEACSRAMALHEAHSRPEQVIVELQEGMRDFVAVVSDCGPPEPSYAIPEAREADLPALVASSIGVPSDDDGEPASAPLRLALIAALVDELTVAREGDRTRVRMRWTLPEQYLQG